MTDSTDTEKPPKSSRSHADLAVPANTPALAAATSSPTVHEFPYIALEPLAIGALRPAIPITLIDGGRPVQTRGLLDSGADRTTLPDEWAALLGIDLKHDCDTQMVTLSDGKESPRSVYTGGLSIEVAGEPIFLDLVQFCPQPWAILGRRDLFDRYLVLLHDRNRRFFLERLAAPEDDPDLDKRR